MKNRSYKWWIRKLHRWGAVLIALPLLLVIVSGLLLQVKKQFAWIQPPTAKPQSAHAEPNLPSASWTKILKTTMSNENTNVKSWEDIDRLDVRPGKGIIKVRCKNRWELQLDAVTGEEIASAYRRSDFIESLHDGSFFSDAAKLWVFLPNGLVLLSLWATGMYLWWLPIGMKRRKKKEKE